PPSPWFSGSPPKRAPGPRGHPVIGNLVAFRRDALRLLLDSHRRHGDVVRFHLGPMVIHLVCHPDDIRQVLITHQHHYDKETRSSAKISGITGRSLLTLSGEHWLVQRRMVQPAFHPQRLSGFAEMMAAVVLEALEKWEAHAQSGEPLDVASEMSR